MKVYVVLIDYADQRPTSVFGVYKQFHTAYQDECRLKKMWRFLRGDDNMIKVRIIDQEVTKER